MKNKNLTAKIMAGTMAALMVFSVVAILLSSLFAH